MNTPEYRAISEFYGDRCAERSGVRLMNHIDEGLAILDFYKASDDAKAAFCLHPLCQSDEELSANVGAGFWYSSKARVIILAMEYRSVANEYLSRRWWQRTNFRLLYREARSTMLI